MPSWKGVGDWAESNPNVKSWAFGKFTDESTRTDYVYHLKKVCETLKVGPDEFLTFLDGKPSELYKRLRQYLVSESTKYYRKAPLEKAAIVSFVAFHNDRPGKFLLDVPLKKREKYARPQWGINEFRQVLDNVHRKYRPLLKLGVMAGLGRKELAYLNQHIADVKPVPGVPEAMYLESMPARKSNSKLWTAILPRDEFMELKKVGMVKTFHGEPIERDDLTVNFKAACERAGIRVEGTAIHVLRSIFESVGLSRDPGPNIPKKYLDQNMGHTDAEHYDRTHQNLTERAKALVPLWEYIRHGPAVVGKSELDERDRQITLLNTQVQLLSAAITQLQAGMKQKKAT